MPDLDPILATWSFTAGKKHSFPVMPDGCRDFIVRLRPGGRPDFYVSSLMPAPEWVSVLKGERFFGVRLRPGARIDCEARKRQPPPESPEELAHYARESASTPANVGEALSCLASARTSALAAQELGVSLRTLQRHIRTATGRSPEFWRRLARARKAARLILGGVSLPEAACDCLYADQAHMTRDVARWFGLTPGELAANRNDDHHWAGSLRHSGYDAPDTGEQISIR